MDTQAAIRVALTLPDSLKRALYSEAGRRGVTPSELAAELLRPPLAPALAAVEKYDKQRKEK